jgi:prevent-host-death family protein
MPMSSVTLQDLERDLPALLDRVAAGECLVVVRAGRPVAELRPLDVAPSAPRPFGLSAGVFAVPDDFDAPLPDDSLEEFEGR